jgi:magnesium transporter
VSDPNLILALDYSNAHPDAAAQVLERNDPAQTAAFFANHNKQLAPSLLQRMVPHYVGQMCQALEVEKAGQLLSSVDVSFVAAVLRCLPKQKQNSILGHMPASRRAACLLLLNFSEDNVGSWMNPNVVSLPGDSDIESARELVKRGENALPSDRLFVVDRARRLLGHVSLMQLTQAKKKQDFARLVVRDDDALLSRMSIQNAAQYPAWSAVDVMPVVNRNQHFVGAIRHVDLRMALEQSVRSAEIPQSESALNGLAQAYGTTFMALFNSLEEILVDTKKGEGK